nr:UDP-N-acetylglucosamine--N-acetylmuramyl-(pentapeptide) pyrophosphoryl-undecaprenol N-acetylglucosamine transferase [Segetibacter sp.]
AMHLVEKKAALIIKDNEANDKLVAATISLAENEVLQRQLSENIGKLALADADEIIAREIIGEMKPQP